jgi:AraC-like DNA-binding protein
MERRLTLPSIQRVVWKLLERGSGQRPTLEEIARPFGLSYRQFWRRLKRAGKRGRTIRSWCCVTYAEHLIGKGIKCEAAMLLAGFRNHTHFNRR